MKIIVDTREQEPLTFSLKEDIQIGRDKLECGDYSIAGYDLPGDDGSIIIERKQNCNELCGNLGANWERFQKELEKMAEYKHKMILVCGPNNFPYIHGRGYTKLHPNFVYKQLSIIHIKYGIPTIFAGTREDAEEYMYRYFKEVIRYAES